MSIRSRPFSGSDEIGNHGHRKVIRLAISERLKPVTYLSTVAVAMGIADFVEDGDIREVSAHRPIDNGYANG